MDEEAKGGIFTGRSRTKDLGLGILVSSPMPPELRRANPGEYLPGALKVEKTVEKFDSEVWEAERDALMDEIIEAFKDADSSDVSVFELTLHMGRYSLKDGLEFAKRTNLDDVSTTGLIREYSGRHDQQQKLVNGKTLRARLLAFIDFRQSSSLEMTLNHQSNLTNRIRDVDEFLAMVPKFVEDDPNLGEKLKMLMRADDDTDPNLPGGARIGDLFFSEKAQPFKEKIDRLYDPFYDRVPPEGMGKVKKFEMSPTVSEANEFLREFKELLNEDRPPVYFVPVQEWLLKELFQTKVKIDGLHWPDIQVESVIRAGEKMPLREAIKEYVTQLDQSTGLTEAAQLKWYAKALLQEPIDFENVSIQYKDFARGLKGFSIDPNRLDIQGLVKRNAVTKLEITFKIQCRVYAEKLAQEAEALKQRLAVLNKTSKNDKWQLENIEYNLRVTTTLENIFAKLAKGELAQREMNAHSYQSTRLSYNGGLQERNVQAGSRAKGILRFLRQSTSEELRDFRPAKIDHFSKTELEEVFHQLFPTIDVVELKKKARSNGAHSDATARVHEQGIYDAESYFDPEDSSYGVDGDPRDPWPKELMKISEPVDAILVTGVYDTRNEQDGKWESEKAVVQTHSPEDLPRKTVIFQLPAKVGMALPIALHGIRAQRVVGITERGIQVPVVVIQDKMGRTIVDSFPPDVKKIAYAQEVPELLPSVTDISENEYQAWLKRQDAKGERRQTKEQAYRLLPVDCRRFVDEIRPLPPAERVRRIESFVREIGYYDFKNGETEGERVGTSLQIRWNLMRQRMKRLQAEKPTDKELTTKKIAGVCVDFQELTTTLLSAVDCIAGKLSALRVHNDIKVTSQDAHALSYVEWPTSKGESMRIPVDGTPSGTNEEEQKDLNNIQEPRQIERADKLEQYRFENEMEEETKKIFPKKPEEEKLAFEKPLSAREAVEASRKQKVATEEDEFEGKKAPTLTRERMIEYLKTALSEQEMHALYRTVGWMAYGGALEQLTKLGAAEDAFDKEGRIKMELSQVYTEGTKESLHQNNAVEATSIVRDWQNACNKLRAFGYSPIRLAALLGDAMPRTTDLKSKRDRSVNYLGRIVSG